jgi:hypothetical protein
MIMSAVRTTFRLVNRRFSGVSLSLAESSWHHVAEGAIDTLVT